MLSSRAPGSVVLAVVLALALCAGASAQYDGAGGASPPAEQQQEKKKERSSRWGRSTRDKDGEQRWSGPRYEIDQRTAKRLIEAREHLMAERYDEAEGALGKLRVKSLNPLELAQTYRIYAFIAYGREDYASARDYLEKTLATEVLDPQDAADVRFQIAQLWLQEQNWAEAARNLETWFTMVETPNAAAYYLLALTYYQLEDLERALVPAQKAVDISEEPRESWLQLLLALRLTRREYQEAIPLLEELVARFPQKSYWLSLSTVYGALGNYEEALVPLQLAYTQGLLTEDSEVRRLAQLLLFLELPYRAALVLKQGLDDGVVEVDQEAFEMLSNSWIAAREYDRAVSPLERAGALAEAGDPYVRLAQVHIQREKWAEAADALRRALDKGGLKDPGDAELLMGIAFYSQKQPQQARQWFARARRHDSTRGEADTWIEHIDRELGSG
jgi:tetratricopeptide (TPR) repeat protein